MPDRRQGPGRPEALPPDPVAHRRPRDQESRALDSAHLNQPEGGAMRTRIVLGAALVIALVAAGSAVGAPPGGTLEFRMLFASYVRSDPTPGRVHVIGSSGASPDPRFQGAIV